jgi:hypothetical protein
MRVEKFSAATRTAPPPAIEQQVPIPRCKRRTRLHADPDVGRAVADQRIVEDRPRMQFIHAAQVIEKIALAASGVVPEPAQ